MAFIAFDFASTTGAAPAKDFAHQLCGFTRAEWIAIRLARCDGVASVRAASPIGSAVRRLFGLEPANRLADPRLEALRRVAVCCWRQRPIDSRQVEALIGAGFSFDHVALIRAHVQSAG